MKFFLFRFGDTADNEFYLNTYQSRSLLLSSLNRLGYLSRGSQRNVQAALNAMRTQQFTGSNVSNINYAVRVNFAPFYFCNNFVKPLCILKIFGTQILKEICNKIVHLC